MAATDASRALLALTSAAFALPGLRVQAAVPTAQPEATAQMGFYQESDARMRVEVYHGNLVLPVHDRLEVSFSLDRDTYSGATPAYSLPTAMSNQLKFSQRDDGSPATALSLVDVVSAASQGATAGELTILGGLNTFKDFIDARSAAEAAFLGANPRPASPPAPPTLPGPVTLDFQGMTFASYSGAANLAAVAGGACPGNGALGCYIEDGMAVGIVADGSNPVAHLHRAGGAANRALAYHADSSGIYIRALDGSAFSLDNLQFVAPLSGANPDAGADDVWEILGFDAAVNPTLDAGDGINDAGRVARQTVANGFNGLLALLPEFQNINSFWIHYRGYPQTPADGKDFEMRLDSVQLSGVQPVAADTPEQLAWSAQLEREVAIAQFQAVLDRVVPAGDLPVQRFQQQPRESRTQPTLNARYFWDDTTLSVSGGISDEPDFESSFGAFNLSREFNERLTTLSVGYGFTYNAITRNDAQHTGAGHTHDGQHNPTDYPELDARSRFHSVNASLGQVLDKHRWLQVSASYTQQRGYLSNPYKFVYVRGEITAEEYYGLWQAADGEVDWAAVTPLEVAGIELFRERRPDLRRQWSMSARLNQHLPTLEATLHLDYRLYRDDWDIAAHTFTAEWYQTLPAGLSLTPYLRYYTQSRAAFFAPYFLAPRADHHYSSDFRLAGFGAASGGLRLAKQLGTALRFEAGVEYYTHQGALKLGGDGAGNYADFSNYMAHASLNVDLSAAAGAHAGGHGAHATHAHAPAGVMFAHRLPEAGRFMVGYRYMDMRQNGPLQAGGTTLTAADAQAGCGSVDCASLMTSMTMRMHMLELMVAPTSWLSLMLMPQIIDGEMDMSPLPGALTTTHLGEHVSDGLGDTLLAAVLRVFERPGQQINLSLGFSAPTGESAATLDGAATPDSIPHDYGMQRGSGTWDARPVLSYLGEQGPWFWGAQLGGTFRLAARNDAGYAPGDNWQLSGWGGRRLTPWLASSLRIVQTSQASVRGAVRRASLPESAGEFSGNQGGRYTDLGIGINASLPGSAFAGHALALEWLQPIADHVNGVQLERSGALMANWSFAF